MGHHRGRRGITAACALELGRRYGLKLHLLGKSPAPQENAPWRNCSEEELKTIKAAVVRQATLEGRSPTDDWDRVRKDREIFESLEKFRAAGVAATYHTCDVGDWDDLDRVLRDVRAQDGPIHGVIHGAGFAKPFRFGTVPDKCVQATVAPKVDGTLALMHLTSEDPLAYFVAFGSLSGRFGGNGLSHYAAANDMLAKLCGWFRQCRPECRTTCFHWQTWDQVGMAMLSDGIGITKNAFKMNFLAPETGVSHCIDELRAGNPESEILITDGYFQSVFYAYEIATATREPQVAPARTGTAAAPLIDKWEPTTAGAGIARITFDPKNDPFLAQHRMKQKPFLPGVIGIESVAEAARCASQGRPVNELRDVRIINGLLFHSHTPMPARVAVTTNADGLGCRLLTELRDRQGRLIDADRVHVEATVPVTATIEPIEARPLDRPPLGWHPHTYLENGLMFHGPEFRCLKEMAFQYDGGWGKIVATPLAGLAGPRSAEGWMLSPAVLDACLVACGGFTFLQFGGVVEVPFAFDRLRWSRTPRPGETCVVRLFFRERTDRHSQFDFILYGENDEPLVQAIGYRTVRLGGGDKR